ncbi:MAG TPA: bifunctional UDP-N-acetylglucosamine diphosphorylase/glucosamine-1-phosphate N-acetyltransferase GlmU [Hyphomicrobiaceae bacterium]|jgi:bifunctional UDP-N-acetylglucosamine pyrophosphorylase/glucosamine-1-phosphate N-acetyltransferase|nr:bifunctional UDP-N-acetylglucosamine diphosphorylase/glucosamine-1-phosphate N-acetyltransferase GlmU [Hyphomicrobiaceae bacterium]
MTSLPLLTVILAAGKGTRMISSLPKVLHQIAGLSMLGHTIKTAAAAGNTDIAVVIGPGMDAVRAEATRLVPEAQIFIQEQQLGTAHAVLAARAAIAAHRGDVVVLFADTPLLQASTLLQLRARLDTQTPLAVLGFEAADPAGYGRLVTDPSGDLVAVREHKDASEAERKITLCCSGVMAFRGGSMLPLLERIANHNAQGEYYLTDAVALAAKSGFKATAIVCSEDEVLGINSREQLAAAEAIYQGRARRRAMVEGATLIAPETVWFSYDTVIGRDVIIEPNVFFGPGVTLEDEVQIRAHCHIEGARLQRGARVGPFARLRPGADLGVDVHIGNFVEVKNVTLGAGAKANHLSYLGDGRVGEGANIGAGTIFCNYDGFNKYNTDIGPGAFVGSNSALVAPVRVGAGAYIGSGSVITDDVPADALALERSPQQVREGWAAKFRTIMAGRKPTRRER